jgi:CrcB protein
MRLLLLATLGGAIGSGARYLVYLVTFRLIGSHFPWATVTVNILGSLLMGFLVEMVMIRYQGSLELRTFLATGILGGFTTFSAFSLDAANLLNRGDTALAFGYIAGSVLLSIAALYLGLALARGVFA